MFNSNYAGISAQEHWAELCVTSPEIPDAVAPAAVRHATDWHLLGEYDWHYSVAIGMFGDDQPENAIAHATRERIRDHIPDLDLKELRSYLDGLHSGLDMYAQHGF